MEIYHETKITHSRSRYTISGISWVPCKLQWLASFTISSSRNELLNKGNTLVYTHYTSKCEIFVGWIKDIGTIFETTNVLRVFSVLERTLENVHIRYYSWIEH